MCDLHGENRDDNYSHNSKDATAHQRSGKDGHPLKRVRVHSRSDSTGARTARTDQGECEDLKQDHSELWESCCIRDMQRFKADVTDWYTALPRTQHRQQPPGGLGVESSY